ncbi:unnamed protein product [Brassica oleracea var. botrytis]|uniref:BZIP domain-containing protein n=3 Tax=Brassica TaxID=3705 RepID=A0A0D3B632_BRAOL|nr:PREDICTED: transcription factor RF2b-like [Brassica oleracea var. oleracea]CAF1700906.1 unnamed protein product [Brassica napus]CDY24896.1 BnaC03g22760D [Brassica napus]VDC89928.1 unnamed protein product [Brassica oleracea]
MDHDPSNAKPNQHPPLTNPSPTSFRGPNHRRAHSEVQFRLPEDLDLSETFSGFDDLGSEDDLFCSFMDIENLGSGPGNNNPFPAENGGGGGREEEGGSSRPRHRHSVSVDGSSSLESIEAKKPMTPEKLAELWVVDPKRAKRIMSNRQSAARSKERKARYIMQLERRVQTLQAEYATRSAHLSLINTDIAGLLSENTELKLRIQAVEQKAKLRDALNEKMKKEAERLRFAAAGQVSHSDAYNLQVARMQYSQQQSFFQQQADAQNMQQMTPQFHLFQPNNNNNNNQNPQLMHHATSNASGQSHSYSEEVHEDHLGSLQGLDISNGSNFGRSSESSSSTM